MQTVHSIQPQDTILTSPAPRLLLNAPRIVHKPDLSKEDFLNMGGKFTIGGKPRLREAITTCPICGDELLPACCCLWGYVPGRCMKHITEQIVARVLELQEAA